MDIYEELAAGLKDYLAKLEEAHNDPLDLIRALTPIAQMGLDEPTMDEDTSAYCRRLALFSLARASAAYQPSTRDDAQAIESLVLDLFDAEARRAANTRQQAVFRALNQLRAAVANDLRSRGTALPDVITVSRNGPLPAVVIANELYGDPRREAELVERNNPANPSFMPLTITAKSR